MGSSLLVRGVGDRAGWLLISSATMLACSAPTDTNESPGAGGGAGQGASIAGQGTNSAGRAGAPSSSGGSFITGGGVASGNGGALATAGSASDAGAAGIAMGVGGGAAGAHSGGGGATGVSGSTTGGSAAGSSAATCQTVKAEYAAELDKQLGCKPGVASQCKDKVAAAAGCGCRVFIQPVDPFAIEHLSNVGNAWYEADCGVAPTCPAQCSTAAAGTCQADAKSPLGGRCVTP